MPSTAPEHDMRRKSGQLVRRVPTWRSAWAHDGRSRTRCSSGTASGECTRKLCTRIDRSSRAPRHRTSACIGGTPPYLTCRTPRSAGRPTIVPSHPWTSIAWCSQTTIMPKTKLHAGFVWVLDLYRPLPPRSLPLPHATSAYAGLREGGGVHAARAAERSWGSPVEREG